MAMMAGITLGPPERVTLILTEAQVHVVGKALMAYRDNTDIDTAPFDVETCAEILGMNVVASTMHIAGKIHS